MLPYVLDSLVDNVLNKIIELFEDGEMNLQEKD